MMMMMMMMYHQALEENGERDKEVVEATKKKKTDLDRGVIWKDRRGCHQNKNRLWVNQNVGGWEES